MKNLDQDLISNIAKKYRLKNEEYIIRGPYIVDGSNYWIIHYVKKNIFKKLHGVLVIVLDEYGNIVKDKETYKKVAESYLTPKINETFINVYSDELETIQSIYNKFMETKLFTEDLLEETKTSVAYDLNLFNKAYSNIINEINLISSLFRNILKHMEYGIVFLNKLLNSNKYRDYKYFVEKILYDDFDLISKLDERFSIFLKRLNDFKKVIGVFRLDAYLYNNLLDSVNNYIKELKMLRDNIRRIYVSKKAGKNFVDVRFNKIDSYYNKMIKRI